LTNPNGHASGKYCGRVFTAADLAIIRQLIASDSTLTRHQLSRIVCDKLGWLRPDGRRKDMSCRVAMLRMHEDGFITLPPPRGGNGNGKTRPHPSPASDPGEAIRGSAGALGELVFEQVRAGKHSSLWNELIERYHYLGYKPLPGAQMRYIAFSKGRLLAALGFGASAWKAHDRDSFIGWTAEQRTSNLHLIVNNARFLIVPWVRCKNLASRILGAIAKTLPADWEERYAYRPVLLETFVEKQRFQGTCYRAANWIHVGETKGRGKLDRYNRRELTVKDIFLYPLVKDFRHKLCTRSLTT
jgi:hypothetical protein